MKLSKYLIALILTVISTILLAEEPNSTKTPVDLWAIAIPADQYLLTTTDGSSNVFSFQTPAANNHISIGFIPYSTTNCGAGGSMGVVSFTNVCIGTSQANKTYYITGASLYNMFITNSKATGSVQCTKERDNNNASINVVNSQMTCSNNACAAFGGVVALPYTLTTGSSC